jgi:hypothetical protein
MAQGLYAQWKWKQPLAANCKSQLLISRIPSCPACEPNSGSVFPSLSTRTHSSRGGSALLCNQVVWLGIQWFWLGIRFSDERLSGLDFRRECPSGSWHRPPSSETCDSRSFGGPRFEYWQQPGNIQRLPQVRTEITKLEASAFGSCVSMYFDECADARAVNIIDLL